MPNEEKLLGVPPEGPIPGGTKRIADTDRVTLRDLYTMASASREAVSQAARDLNFAIESVQTSTRAQFDSQNVRIDKLIDTTNHRLEGFENQMELRRLEVLTAIGRITPEKIGAVATKDVTGIVRHDVLVSKMSWTVAAMMVVAMSPILADHWHELAERVTHLPFPF